jgi:Protein of unknown function (DUF1552)
MFITKKSLSRRTVLRGMGVSLALPLFDSMVPAQTPLRKTAAAPRTRLACIEMVHGAAGSTAEGTAKGYWIPSKTGRDFDFTMSLKPVEQFRDYLTIISNTDLHHAEAFNATEDGADHFRSSAVYLTAAHPKQTEGSDVRCGVSLDQMYAQEFGQDTPLPSIQLCIENVDASGSCGYNYSCVYSDTISWANPSTPLPMTIDPRMAFENLFGDGGSQQERMTRQRENRSILDQILGEANALRKQLPARDQNRLNTYLENVREIERRIQKIEQYNASGAQRELPAAPLGVPDSWEEHVKLMFDLQVLAFAAEVTRVSAFKMSRDTSQRVFPGSGVKSPFHSLSHHGEKPETVEELARLNRYHVSTVAYFLDKLKNTPDGDGNLLDHSLVVYGSPMGDSNVHGHKRLPLFLAGHAGGQLAGNHHVATPDGTPAANAWLAVLKKLGVNADRFGDSNGVLEI